MSIVTKTSTFQYTKANGQRLHIIIDCENCKDFQLFKNLKRCNCVNCKDTLPDAITSKHLKKVRCGIMYQNILDYFQNIHHCSIECFYKSSQECLSKTLREQKEKVISLVFHSFSVKMKLLYKTILDSDVKSDVMSYIRFSSDICKAILPIFKKMQTYVKGNQNTSNSLIIAFHILPVIQDSPISITYGLRSMFDILMQKFQKNVNLLNVDSNALFNFLTTINGIFKRTDDFAIKNDVINFYRNKKKQIFNCKPCCPTHEEYALCQYLWFVSMFHKKEILNGTDEDRINKMIVYYLEFLPNPIFKRIVDFLKKNSQNNSIGIRTTKIGIEKFIESCFSNSTKELKMKKTHSISNLLKENIIHILETQLQRPTIRYCDGEEIICRNIIRNGYNYLYTFAMAFIEIIHIMKTEKDQTKMNKHVRYISYSLTVIPPNIGALFCCKFTSKKHNLSTTPLDAILWIDCPRLKTQILGTVLTRYKLDIFSVWNIKSYTEKPMLIQEKISEFFSKIIFADDIVSFKVLNHHWKGKLPTDNELCRVNYRHFIRFLIEEETRFPQKNKIISFLFQAPTLLLSYKTSTNMNILHLLCSLPFVEKYTKKIMNCCDHSIKLLQEKNHVHLTPIGFARERNLTVFETTIRQILSERIDVQPPQKKQKI